MGLPEQVVGVDPPPQPPVQAEADHPPQPVLAPGEQLSKGLLIPRFEATEQVVTLVFGFICHGYPIPG
jgi:hypothetical protein